jgi:pimeloyl-ACP methyl ester carboxylesterase
MSVLTPFNFGFEYKLAPEVVVFSHGFGVGRDNRGLFTGITECLPSGLGYVLFDYYDYNDALATVVLTDFTEQTKRLRQVIDWAQKQPGVVKVHLVAHSIGCIVAALPPSREPQRRMGFGPFLDRTERTVLYRVPYLMNLSLRTQQMFL